MLRSLLLCLLLIAVSAPAFAQGWSGGKAEALPQNLEPLSAEEQPRYDAMALRIVEILNARDAEAMRALFSDEGWANAIDWWHSLFAGQFEAFGSISAAWAPRRGAVKAGRMAVRGEERNGASFLIHFEKSAGGLLSFELDEQGRIVHSSVWVDQGLGSVQPNDVPAIYPAE